MSLSVQAAGSFQVSPLMGGVFEGPSVASPMGIYWNPAAIGLLKGTHVYGALDLFFLRGTYDRDGFDPNTGGGYDTATWSGFGPLPKAAVTSDFGTDRWVGGIGLYVPFGGSIDYGDDDLFGAQRYHIIDAELAAIHVTPTVAVKVFPHFYVGAGISWVHTQFQSSVDVDLAAALSNVGISPDAAGAGLEDPLVEAAVQTGMLRDNSVGWELGVLWEALPELDLGLSYRSEVEVSLSGGADVAFPLFPPELGPLLSLGPVAPGSQVSTDVSFQFRWPQSVQLGATYRFWPRWTGIAILQWTNWSRFGRFESEVLTPPLSESSLDLSRARGLNDTVLLSLAVHHQWFDGFKIGGRFAYESPAVPTEFVNPQNYDSHTFELGLGAEYRLMKNLSLSLNYAHLFFAARNVTGSVFDPADPTREGYNYASGDGTYEASADKLELALEVHF